MDVLQKLVPWVAIIGLVIGLLIISYGGWRTNKDGKRKNK